MDHQEIKDKLLTFNDLESSSQEHREILRHLQSCEECRNLLSRWERVGRVLSRAVMPEPSESFVNKVMNRIDGLEGPVPEKASPVWAIPRWVFPTLGYLFALSLMLFAILEREPILINTETVLLSNVPNETQWAFSKDPPEINKLLGMKEEI